MALATPRFRTFLWFTIALCANEGFSYLGYLRPAIGDALFFLIAAGTLIASWRRIEFGVLLVFAELFVGGKGYLFSFTVGSLTISLRLAMFIMVVAVWLFKYGFKRNAWPKLPRTLLGWSLAVGASVALGVLLGLIAGHGGKAVFFDANAYAFLAFGIVLLSRIMDWQWLMPRIFSLLAAAAVLLGLKSVLVLGLFVKLRADHLVTLYRWIRNTGVGEVAPIFGGTYRVFFQSQVYGMLAVLALSAYVLPTPASSRATRWILLPMTFGLTATIVSLSRSFWIGGGAAFVMLFLLGRRWFHWTIRDIAKVIATSAGVFVVAFTLNSWALNFPYPYRFGGRSAGDILSNRLTDLGGASAAKSRTELLKALVPLIERRPVLGYGFGKTVTYQSKDPRQLQSANHGVYTTYAFELGYLDMLVKFGVIGLTAFLGLLATALVRLYRRRSAVAFGMFAGLFALAVIHLTTPYLNHPLGIGFLLLAIAVTTLPAEETP